MARPFSRNQTARRGARLLSRRFYTLQRRKRQLGTARCQFRGGAIRLNDRVITVRGAIIYNSETISSKGGVAARLSCELLFVAKFRAYGALEKPPPCAPRTFAAAAEHFLSARGRARRFDSRGPKVVDECAERLPLKVP